MEKRINISNLNPKSPISEAYRILRTNIQYTNIDKNIKSIVVTSPGPGEGKSTIAANFSVTMSQNQRKILLIDSDLRKPTVNVFFGLSNQMGLTNVLVENVEYTKIVQSTKIGKLDVLSSGPIPPNPSELLGTNKMKSLLQRLKEDYDMVILDSPPIGIVTDAAVLSAIADGVILVCAAEQTIIEEAKKSKALLQQVNANILGVVMNKIPLNTCGYYTCNYYDVGEKTSKSVGKKKVKANV
ncbi:CpsD/CapB family tyrosine-protein kinase [Clostridiaceae bacterium 35-E11]